MDRWNPDGISTFSWLACSLQNSSFFFLVVFACKQHTLYVSKYLLKWSKISLLLYRLLVSLWVGVVWAKFLQQNLTNKQTIIIVLLVYLDQEVQKSVIERRSAMWGYLGSKITESQQSFVKEMAICICKQQKENMGFCFVPECNHAQEPHTCQFFSLRYRNFATMATWRNNFSSLSLCLQQSDLQPFPFYH